jgi:hypothetical protein
MLVNLDLKRFYIVISNIIKVLFFRNILPHKSIGIFVQSPLSGGI